MTNTRFRLPALIAAAALALPVVALADGALDHPVPSSAPSAPPSPAFQSGGEGAKWESLGTIFTGNPHTDLDFFSAKGAMYAAVGTLGAGANGGGVTIAQVANDKGEPTGELVAGHPSASCSSSPAAATGLQHDIEVTPKPSTAPLNTANALATFGDAQLILDATDASGRCHDQGLGGIASAPRGGLEIIDVSEGPDQPKEIGMTSHIGEAHTVNIDPKRPHIAYAVSSDSVGVNAEGVRANEEKTTNAAGQDTTSFALDGFEVVDLSSCMNFPVGTTLERKRELCKPQVYRYRYPSPELAQGHAADDEDTPYTGTYACHELEIYPDDRLTCGSGAVSMLFDMKGAFDDNGTPNDYTDDKPRGTPLPCAVRPSSSAVPELKSGAFVTDCVKGMAGDKVVDLRVPYWKEIGAPSLEGVKHLGTARHIGRAGTGQRAKFDSTQDIDFSHETELTHSGRYMISSDERGGGILPPGASCDQPDANKDGNGGLHFYDVSKLQTTYTGDEKVAWEAYAKNAEGEKAIYRVPIRTGAQATICTAHVFQQIPGQNRIFMAWYSQGTQVLDFTERPDGTLDIKEAGYMIPAGANQWTSAVYKYEKNADGTYTYYGAAGDFRLTEGGRAAIDLYKVTLPAPPAPRLAGSSKPAQQGTVKPATGSKACAAATRLRNVGAKGTRGGGLRIGFRSGSKPVDVTVQQVAGRSDVIKPRTVARFRGKTKAFTWKPRVVADGVYRVKVRVRATNSVRNLAVQRRGGRFVALGRIERRAACDEIRRLALVNPAFGGRSGKALRLVVRSSKAGTVNLEMVRNGKVVRRVGPKVLAKGASTRVGVPARGLAKGRYKVRVLIQLGQVKETLTLRAARL